MKSYIPNWLKIVTATLSMFIVILVIVIKVFYSREEYIPVSEISTPKILIPSENKIDIDTYSIVNAVQGFLSKDNISSEVFAFNNINSEVYNFKNQEFYEILSIAKELFRASDKDILPIKCNDRLDTILLNKTSAKKLKNNVQIDLDDFIEACVVKRISLLCKKQRIYNFYLQYGDNFLLCGNQDKNTSGWNISKTLKYMEKPKTISQGKNGDPILSVPYDLKQHGEIEKEYPLGDIMKREKPLKEDKKLFPEKTVTLNLAGMKDKAICFINPAGKNNIIGGVVISDNLFLSRTMANVAQEKGFAFVEELTSRLRYHDCQYFILYYNPEGQIESQKSFGLDVKEKDNCFNISFYGR